MPETPFDLAAHFDTLYAARASRLALQARTRDDFLAWQARIREATAQMLGVDASAPPAGAAEQIHSRDRGGFQEIKLALTGDDGVQIPVYLLVPSVEPPYRPIVLFHGHNPSIQPVLGNYATQQEAEESRGRDGNYAEALARAGFLVCAVEQRGFGERQSDREGGPNSCRHQSFAYLMQGTTMIGQRCRDGLHAVSWLLQRDDLKSASLGCTGNSGGGTTALWLSILDERITCAVPSCYFCSFRLSIRGQYHCECNYIPNALQIGEMGDFAAALAPRPVRFINGRKDPIFPIEGVLEQFETVQRGYGLLGAGDRLDLAIHEGEHRYDHALAREWFERWL